MMKKKMMLWMTFLLGTVIAVHAQRPGGPKGEKIEAMKVGFITQKLNLTPEEAQKFWPVYNKFSGEMEKCHRSFRGRMMDEMNSIEDMTDAEAEKTLNDMIVFKTTEVELIKKYTVEFKKVLPPQKVVKLFGAEQEFKRELLKRLRDQRGN